MHPYLKISYQKSSFFLSLQSYFSLLLSLFDEKKRQSASSPYAFTCIWICFYSDLLPAMCFPFPLSQYYLFFLIARKARARAENRACHHLEPVGFNKQADAVCSSFGSIKKEMPVRAVVCLWSKRKQPTDLCACDQVRMAYFSSVFGSLPFSCRRTFWMHDWLCRTPKVSSTQCGSIFECMRITCRSLRILNYRHVIDILQPHRVVTW